MNSRANRRTALLAGFADLAQTADIGPIADVGHRISDREMSPQGQAADADPAIACNAAYVPLKTFWAPVRGPVLAYCQNV